MRAGGRDVRACPRSMVEQVQELKADALRGRCMREGRDRIGKDKRYPLRSLLPLLGEIDTPDAARAQSRCCC